MPVFTGVFDRDCPKCPDSFRTVGTPSRVADSRVFKIFRKSGGVDGARTRDLWRDSSRFRGLAGSARCHLAPNGAVSSDFMAGWHLAFLSTKPDDVTLGGPVPTDDDRLKVFASGNSLVGSPRCVALPSRGSLRVARSGCGQGASANIPRSHDAWEERDGAPNRLIRADVTSLRALSPRYPQSRFGVRRRDEDGRPRAQRSAPSTCLR